MRRNNRFIGSYENRDKRLVIAIVTCQCSVCQLMFGVFLIIGGSMLRAFSSEDEGPFAEYNKTPRLIGTILLAIGVSLTVIGAVLVVAAGIIYNRYEIARNLTNQNSLRNQTEMESDSLQLSMNDTNLNENISNSEIRRMQENCSIHGSYLHETENSSPDRY